MKNEFDIQCTLIGLFLKWPEKYLDVSDLLKPEMFHEELRPIVKKLFDWCVEKDEIDLTLLASDTGTDKDFLRNLFKNPAMEEASEYAARINSAYLNRFTRDKFTEALKDLEIGKSSEKILEQTSWQISQEIDACTPSRQDRISDSIKETMDIFYKSLNDKEISGIDTGDADLNSITGGWQPTDQIIVAGRPGMGKTTLALNFALKLVMKGVPIAIFSLEMSKVQLINVLASIMTGISTQNIRSGNLNKHEVNRLEKIYHKIGEMPIFLYDDYYDISAIVTKVAQLKRKFDIKIAFYDYVQLIEDSNRYNNRHQQIEHVSRRLKQLAKKEKITNIVLAQLSRTVESRGDKRPLLSDLKESGSIEQDADMVMMIYREGYYLMDDSNTLTELLIRKYRHGRTGILTRYFENRIFKMYQGQDNGMVPQATQSEVPF